MSSLSLDRTCICAALRLSSQLSDNEENSSWTDKKFWGGTVALMIKWQKQQSGTSWTDKKLWKHHKKLVKARRVAMERAHFQATQQALEFLAANPLPEEQTCQREKCPNVHRNGTLCCSKACLDMGAMLTKEFWEQKLLMHQMLMDRMLKIADKPEKVRGALEKAWTIELEDNITTAMTATYIEKMKVLPSVIEIEAPP